MHFPSAIFRPKKFELRFSYQYLHEIYCALLSVSPHITCVNTSGHIFACGYHADHRLWGLWWRIHPIIYFCNFYSPLETCRLRGSDSLTLRPCFCTGGWIGAMGRCVTVAVVCMYSTYDLTTLELHVLIRFSEFEPALCRDPSLSLCSFIMPFTSVYTVLLCVVVGIHNSWEFHVQSSSKSAIW